jgi:hypothetical protein
MLTVKSRRRIIPMDTAKNTHHVHTFVLRPLNKLATITAEKTIVYKRTLNRKNKQPK